MARDILIVGLNHRTAPVAVRERLGFQPAELQPTLTRLMGVPGVQEGAIVSTCNRVELVTCTEAVTADVERELAAFLARERDVAPEAFTPHLYARTGRDAVRHLFRVASSLDSMVVGEPQILGQLKNHYAEASAAGTSGSVLHRAFHRSFKVAKRVRNETGIAARAVSVASVAVDLTRTIFETIADKTAMLIGAGKMSELVARHLRTARHRRDDHHHPHLRQRGRARPRVQRHPGAVRAHGRVPEARRRRDRLGRRGRLSGDAGAWCTTC